MRQARASRPSVVHSPSHGMNTCESSKKLHFVDGFYDSFSSGLGHDRGHASSASLLVHDMFLMVLVLVLILDPRETVAIFLVEALVLLLELLFLGKLPREFQVLLI